MTGILKEKTDAAVPDDAASFVSVTRELATGSAPEAGGQGTSSRSAGEHRD